MSNSLPCPFCGARPFIRQWQLGKGGSAFRLVCSGCCAQGAIATSSEDAARKWDTRHRPGCAAIKVLEDRVNLSIRGPLSDLLPREVCLGMALERVYAERDALQARVEALEEGLRELITAIPEDFFTREGGDQDEVRPWLPLGALRRARALLEETHGD